MEAIKYHPPGSVAAAFHRSEAFVRGLLGPVGSGKSSTCVMEIIKHTLKQKPHNGWRKARWCVIRNTYPELKSTTIKTWQDWIPNHLSPIKYDAPISTTFKVQDCGDGNGLELEVLFMALDKPEETGKLRSLELTGAWINEASEVPKEVFDMVTQRVGRYPAKRNGGPTHPCVILDTNPPDDDHWYYKIAEEDKPEGWDFFKQPGGLLRSEDGLYIPNPDAENIFNLPNGYGYYFQQLGGKKDDWINVFLLGRYGTTATGKPVYPEYNDNIHVAKEDLEPLAGVPVIVGFDFGLTPSAAIIQLTPKGQLLILDELIGEDMGIRQFASDVVRPLLMTKYSRNKITSVGDPAGMNRAQTDERTCFQELYEVGIAAEPANTNDFLPRRESVAFYLTKMAGGEPGMLISPSCKTIRKGFIGGYRYERLRVAGERYKDRPVKDKFSHPHDALQYACLATRVHVPTARARAVSKKAVAWT